MKNEYKAKYEPINLWLRNNRAYTDITFENSKIKFYVKYNRVRFTVLSDDYESGIKEVYNKCLKNKRYKKRKKI